MLFNSVQFVLFFMAFCLFYFLLPSRYRVWLVLIASYGFYMAWKPIYGFLMLGVTLVSYWGGYQVQRSPTLGQKRFYLWLTVAIDLGILCYFKYANFGVTSLNVFLHTLGWDSSVPALKVLLPVGISFYVFQALSFTVDVYRNNFPKLPSLVEMGAYIAFFPQLVAGPIERADNLIPQLTRDVKWSATRANSGLRLMLWGLFKKVVVADNLASYVDSVYNNPSMHTGPSIVLATIAFAFQIYCDFSGYTDTAIGTARVLGIDLMQNFDRPYISQSITEFWRRWHISLSTWLRDYLYISLGGNRVGQVRTYLNLMITMLLGGLWHGASWTFVLWGGLQGVLLVAERMLLGKRANQRSSGLIGSIRTVVTFGLVCLSWMVFRINSFPDLMTMVSRIPVGWPDVFVDVRAMAHGALGVSVLLLVESRASIPVLGWFETRRPFRIGFYYGLAVLILLVGVLDGSQFIYFQF